MQKDNKTQSVFLLTEAEDGCKETVSVCSLYFKAPASSTHTHQTMNQVEQNIIRI